MISIYTCIHNQTVLLSLRFPHIKAGLYRDNALIAVPNGGPQSCDRIRKGLRALFKDLGFSITTSSHLKPS